MNSDATVGRAIIRTQLWLTAVFATTAIYAAGTRHQLVLRDVTGEGAPGAGPCVVATAGTLDADGLA
ncbi:MAG: hypothetical protein ACO4BZ_03110, partial [Ilumatobacteraceae bacterium]